MRRYLSYVLLVALVNGFCGPAAAVSPSAKTTPGATSAGHSVTDSASSPYLKKYYSLMHKPMPRFVKPARKTDPLAVSCQQSSTRPNASSSRRSWRRTLSIGPAEYLLLVAVAGSAAAFRTLSLQTCTTRPCQPAFIVLFHYRLPACRALCYSRNATVAYWKYEANNGALQSMSL